MQQGEEAERKQLLGADVGPHKLPWGAAGETAPTQGRAYGQHFIPSEEDYPLVKDLTCVLFSHFGLVSGGPSYGYSGGQVHGQGCLRVLPCNRYWKSAPRQRGRDYQGESGPPGKGG